MDDILTTSFEAVVCGFTAFLLDRYFHKDGERKVENTTSSSSSSMLCSNRIDTVDSSVSSSVRSEIPEDIQIEARISHNHLKNGLLNEIQDGDSEEFQNIQLYSMNYIGRANALACRNIGGIFTQLENKGKISPGNYSVLEKILEDSGMNHYRVKELFENVKEKIQRALSEPSSLVESISSSCGESASTTDGNAVVLTDILKDGVIFYAETDDARKTAIKFKEAVTQITRLNATIELKEETGHGNCSEFQSWERLIKEYRYIFFLMTDDLDSITLFAADTILYSFMKKNQNRVVPIWLSSDRSGHPMFLSGLTGQNYYLMRNTSLDVKEIFKKGFQNLINKGRGQNY